MSVTPDTRIAVITSLAGLVWWDIRRRIRISGFGSSGLNHNAAPSFSADGRWALFPDGALVRMDTRQLVKIVPSEASSNGKTEFVSSDGSTAAVAGGDVAEIVRLSEFNSLPLPGVVEFALWPDGRHLTSVGYDGEVTAWNLDPPSRFSRSPVKPDPGSNSPIYSLSYGGGRYAVVDSGQRIHVWDLTARRPTALVLGGRWHKLRAISIDPTGAFLAIADDDRVYVMGAGDEEVMASVPLPTGYLAKSVEISRGGRYVAVTDSDSGGSIVWEFKPGRLETVSPAGALYHPVFSPDGRWLGASEGPEADGAIVWDPERRAEARRFAGSGIVAFDSRGTVIALYAPSGVASANLLEVRDLRHGRLISAIDTLAVDSVVFTPDGRRLATIAGEALTEHPLDPASALAHVCQVAGRELTEAEWKTYADGFPYERVCATAG